MSTVRIIFIRNNTNVETSWVKGFSANEEFQIPQDTSVYYRYRTNSNLLSAIANGDASIGNGAEYFDNVTEQIYWLVGWDNVTGKDEIGRDRVVIEPELHASSHAKDGEDEINVEGLSGQLEDQQHPVPSECVDAMGTKVNTNPLNHDRFQQTEIEELPEEQLSLNYSTHNNANDPTSNEKSAMSNAETPNSGNPFLTKSNGDSLYSETGHTHATLPTTDQKDALDNANSPSSSNAVATMDDIANIEGSNFVKYYSDLPTASEHDGEVFIVLADENDDEAGRYRSESNVWVFYSSTEDHTHTWSQVNKASSKLVDIADVPAYPNDGNEYDLTSLNGVPVWKLRSSNSSKARYVLMMGYNSSTWWRFLEINEVRTDRGSYLPFQDLKVVKVSFNNQYEGDSNGGDLESIIKVYSESYDYDYNVDDDGTLEFEIDSESSNITQKHSTGRNYIYDASSENFVLSSNKQYAFLFHQQNGWENAKNIIVQFVLEEI